MAAIRFSSLKSLYSSVEFVNRIDIRPSFAFIRRDYRIIQCRDAHVSANLDRGLGMMSSFAMNNEYSRRSLVKAHFSFRPSSILSSRACFCFGGINALMNYRAYSSSSGTESNVSQGMEDSAAMGASGSVNGGDGGEWLDKAKELWQSTIDAVKYTGEKAKEASNEVNPYIQQLLDTHPYLRDVIVPIGATLAGTLFAWVALPKVLRRFHKYAMQGPAALLGGSSLWGPVPYEQSFWGALEDPVRYLILFMAFSQIGTMVAPTTIAAEYVTQAWRGGIIISLVWFLHRWKTNVITRALAAKGMEGVERDKLLTLDKISSVGLFVVGLMAFAEASGVAVQSILTVGGIGGVATAFAARDILGNLFSGLSLQLARPFSVGDTIKAGSVEGQVIEMGLTATSLLTADRFPAIVPNSLFSSQVIVNKSRAQWRALVTKIPLQTDDMDKIPLISEDIKKMLRSNPNVFLGREAPYCFLSRVEKSYAELTLGCNVKHQNKEAEQDILLESIRIIKQHGATLGSTQ